MIPCATCDRPAFVHVHGLGDRCARHAREAYEIALAIEVRPVTGESDAPRAVVTSVRVSKRGAHEHLAAWNRGAYAGALMVQEGDGFTLAARLLGVARGGE